MHEHESWLTALFNDHLAGLANTVLSAVGIETSPRPWVEYMTMQVLVVAILMVVFAILRPKLSMDKPGGMQHIFEGMYSFLSDQAHDNIHHHHRQYVPFFGSIFLFVLFANLIGIIPTMESPTMFPAVPAGLAMGSFLFYNAMGFKEGGAGYLKQFIGPDIGFGSPARVAMSFLMIPIEIVSHSARPISLTIRLFANMFAGEKVTIVFLSISYLVAPAVFMGLHVFVSFIQAYVFALLTMIYVGAAVSHDH